MFVGQINSQMSPSKSNVRKWVCAEIKSFQQPIVSNINSGISLEHLLKCEWCAEQHHQKTFLTRRTGCGSPLPASGGFFATARFPLARWGPWHFSGTPERWITARKKRQRPAALKIYGLTHPYVKSGEMGPALKATIKYISIRAVCSCNTCFNLMGSRQMSQAVIWKIISKRLTLSLSYFWFFL